MSADAAGIGAVAAGAVFLYAGIKGISVTAALQAVVQGKSPSTAPQVNAITSAAASPATAAGFSIATDIPASSGAYDSASALEKLWTDNGGPSNTAAFAAAIAKAESGGNAGSTSANPDGGENVGVFQLDTKGVGSGYTEAELKDANLNTQITIMATAGGVNWSDWGDPVAAAVGYHYTPGSAVP